MEIYTSTVSFFQDGGLFMYPIVAIFALGVAIAIERYVFLTAASATNKALWKKVTPFLKSGKFKEAVALTSKSTAAIGPALRMSKCARD